MVDSILLVVLRSRGPNKKFAIVSNENPPPISLSYQRGKKIRALIF